MGMVICGWEVKDLNGLFEEGPTPLMEGEVAWGVTEAPRLFIRGVVNWGREVSIKCSFPFEEEDSVIL